MLMVSRRRVLGVCTGAVVVGCGRRGVPDVAEPPLYANETPELRALINHFAD